MRVTANQVTLTRLVLLPLPVWMVYRQTPAWMLTALVIFVVLGLTDAVDGYLARRYGSTPLGALLDPIVDKIFLVAAYGPLADLRIVPPYLVTVIFVREFAITALRSVALEEGVTFRTSRIAKLKTTVQFAGAGFILLYWLFRSGPPLLAVQVGAVVAAIAAPTVQLARGRTPQWRAWSAFVLLALVGSVRWVLDAQQSMDAVMALIVGVTLISGLEYVWRLRATLLARFRRTPVEAIRFAALAVVVPIGFLPAMQRDGAPIWAILGVVALELAAGGVDNALAQVGRTRGPWPDLVRAGAQAVGAVVMVAALSGGQTVLASLAGAFAVLATFADVVGRFWRHRDHFLALSTMT